MVSMEDYKRLREEIHRLLTEGENLMDDDEFLLDLISCSNDSKDVLELVRALKEEGNVLYKQRKFEDALEKYGYAGLVLARYEFVEKSDMGACFELAICVLLNSEACFGKKNEFENVGRICSIILEFEPSNLKALFRRALAALELGRSIWAYWDLLLAVQVDPNNREVASKLEEVKSSLRKEESIKRSQSVVPLGLGSSLSPPRKNTKGSLKQEAGIEHKDMQRKVSSSGATDKRNHDGLASIVDSGPKGCSSLKGEKTLNEIKKTVNGKNEVKKSNLMEPKYRFANRRRSGSLMSISKKDYNLLSTGKSIQCMKLGYLMTVRVVMDTKEGIKRKDVSQEEIMVASSDSGQPNRIGVIGDTIMELEDQTTWSVTQIPVESQKGDEYKEEVEDNEAKKVLKITSIIRTHSCLRLDHFPVCHEVQVGREGFLLQQKE